MKNKKVKRIIIAAIIVAAVIVVAVVVVKQRKDSNVAEVQSVAGMNYGYWGDEVYSYGMVTNDHAQTVYVGKDDVISEVYVEEGQQVKAGDKLMALDMALSNLDYDMKELEVEKLNNQIAIVQNELKKLKNTKPVSNQTSYVESNIPDPEPEDPVVEKEGDVYRVLTPEAVPYNVDKDTFTGLEKLEIRSLVERQALLYHSDSDTSDKAETEGNSQDESGDNTTEGDDQENPGDDTTGGDDQENPGDDNAKDDTTGENSQNGTKEDVKEENVPGDGSKEHPYRYLCTQDAYVTGDLLIALSEYKLCAVFEIHKGNKADGKLLSEWEVDGSKLPVPDADTKWLVASRTKYVEEEKESDVDDSYYEEPDTSEPGYTKEELASMIAEKEKELKDLDLSKRKAELDVKKAGLNHSDGIVYATMDGTVKNMKDEQDAKTEGTPFFEVRGEEGLYVSGTISELLLDRINLGETMITVNSWESGVSCEAVITELSYYPSGSSSYGEGNSNVSYYPFTAYIEDTSGLTNGEYVDMTMTLGQEDGGSSIYLPKAYVRTEDGQSYVMIADENDRLKKQFVSTGKIIYGDTIEIKSGITEEDRIAFPYGKTAKEGARVKDAEGGMY